MRRSIKKVTLNYQKYEKLIVFTKAQRNTFFIKGFFGSTTCALPKTIYFKINKKDIVLYISEKSLRFMKINIKSILYRIRYFIHGAVFNHAAKVFIKGIGYKFELKNSLFRVHSGKAFPGVFNYNSLFLEVLTNGTTNTFTVLGGNLPALNNFANCVRGASLPTK